MNTLKTELAQLKTPGLVAYFNILRAPTLGKSEKDTQHLTAVRELLAERGLGSVSALAEKSNRRLIAA